MSNMDQKRCFKTLRISSSASYFMHLTKLLLISSSLIAFSSGAGQVPCESVSISKWSFNGKSLGGLKSCHMVGSTVIDAPDFTISTPRDETVQGLSFNRNYKISFLPLETEKKFPNLVGYGAFDCSLKVVKKENFQNLNKLQWIWLRDNQIETIFSDTFEGLISLEHINLSDNWISQMNGKTFAGLNNLKKVYFNKNQCINEGFTDQTKIATLTSVVTEKCNFTEELRLQEVNTWLDTFINTTNQQLHEVQPGTKAVIDSKLIISRLENELKSAKEDITTKVATIAKLDIDLQRANIVHEQTVQQLKVANSDNSEKATTITRIEAELTVAKSDMAEKLTSLEAERDTEKIAQRQAESQILLIKNLFEKLDFQHNQTCIAKTEELRNQVESKMREIEGLRADVNNKNERIKKQDEILQRLSQYNQW